MKTDARDALHLARLLHLSEITAVTVPTVEQEAARGLVRAREDVRGDLMSARHRLSKLLLRQGIVYSGGKAWTGVHDTWLRQQRFALAGRRWPTTPLTRRCWPPRSGPPRQGDRGDGRRLHAPGRRAVASSRGASTLTPGSPETRDWQRLSGAASAPISAVPTEHSSGSPVLWVDHQDRQRPRPPTADRSRRHHRPALLAPGADCADAGTMRPRQQLLEAVGNPGACTCGTFTDRKKTS